MEINNRDDDARVESEIMRKILDRWHGPERSENLQHYSLTSCVIFVPAESRERGEIMSENRKKPHQCERKKDEICVCGHTARPVRWQREASLHY
jgi:reverse gyrase